MAHDLAIVGPLPPPIGGIGVHYQKLLPYLDQAGVDYIVYNPAGPTEIPGRAVSVARRKVWWFARYLFFGKEPVVYVATTKWTIWAASWILSRLRGKKVVIAVHGESLARDWKSNGRLVRRLIRGGLCASARLIAVNKHVADAILDIGDFASKTIIAPAFIPPIISEDDPASLPDDVKAFREDHDPIILATGAPVLWDDNVDLYGIDMTIELVDRLRASHPRIGVLWFMLDFIGSLPAYAEAMRDRVQEKGLQEHWMFHPPISPFHPMYPLADVFIRPTVSDGDAISVREALHFGVPTVVSDAVPRPEGVILFRKRDQDDFERAVRHTLGNLEAERKRLEGRPSDTAVDEEVALLKEVIREAQA